MSFAIATCRACGIVLMTLAPLLAVAPAFGATKDGEQPAARSGGPWATIAPHFRPPPEYAGKLGRFRSPLIFEDGRKVTTPQEWPRRRAEIRRRWDEICGPWPALLPAPAFERLGPSRREDFTQHKVRVGVAERQTLDGYLLVPDGPGPFPAVLAVFYDRETSAGLAADAKKARFRDFAHGLTKRGFVTLSIGSPGGDARKPDTAGHVLQPLSYLAYVAANCHTALARLPEVDPARIGVVGHSYGGKWAMFASCLHDKFAAAAWSDGGVVFDESRSNVNYWEPWYLGLDPKHTRKPGVITGTNGRTGAYKTLIERGHDLHELHALMAPRPFLVSGGSEDPPARWEALNHAIAVNALLGQENRVAMTNRPTHGPTAESNEVLYAFFEHFLGQPSAAPHEEP